MVLLLKAGLMSQLVTLDPDWNCYIFCLPGTAPCSILAPSFDSLLNMDSQTFIHLSTILQSQNYFFASLVASWVYDCFLTLDQEVSLIHWPRWSKGSILYIMARYMPALMLSVHLCMNYLPNEKIVTCKILQSMWYCTAALCVAGAEGIFMLRTYALWGQNKSILGLMLSTVLCLGILNMVITLKVWKQSRQIMVLTMIRVYWAYRERRCLLLDILLQHNIFYFGAGLRNPNPTRCRLGVLILFLRSSTPQICLQHFKSSCIRSSLLGCTYSFAIPFATPLIPEPHHILN
ncbi:uncharacterized protein F5147DRAFT_757178 [Suillus discolor]|uniref:DUF6533 domain-containing protein n=1 Tax=Suillus discolor TaxID=1912936 RepID=A0A9P7JZR0_9AGAM|nr:uncharacterized protein F5147DRAFT_757178 [Suillus discolor]KAG2118701.1 hypothetical protein F5147DRAFT_757178 [Suillus discolor]